MLGSKWRKVKIALGFNLCLHSTARTTDDSELLPESSANSAGRRSDAVSKDSTDSSKMICAICLNALTPGSGHAIFTAECSHSFHFQCISSNVKHGNQICPICRAKWKEIPFQNSSLISLGRTRSNLASRPQDDSSATGAHRLPSPRVDYTVEPSIFDDDEFVNLQLINEQSISRHTRNPDREIEIKTYTEVPGVPKASSHCNFTVLIHVKAPKNDENCIMEQPDLALASENSRTPVDLVTVLDVSGSMAGTKLALLKQAMGFVIQHLGTSDRLSIIVFSSSARRLFPLRRMTEIGKREALQAVNLLISSGGTNIFEGLRKGTKVIIDRKWKNAVSSIILLSDGQDTFTSGDRRTEHLSVLPTSLNSSSSSGFSVPVHTFGFGIDHDAITMHSISESSGGTFSFIESESAIQDAFAQCIGGLLSVVVQDLRVELECIHPMLKLSSIKAGSYRTSLTPDARMAYVELGDIYAEEERDFLVTLDIPMAESNDDMSLLKVKCIYKDPISKELLTKDHSSDVKIQRPEMIGEQVTSVEVDRQMNRIQAAEAMAEARSAADMGDLSAAVNILENCRRRLEHSVSARAGDRLCVALVAELKEMKERMASRQTYESTGRAYVLSGLSSHSWQRATAHGDSTDSTSLVQAYHTTGMTDMVTRSQALSFSGQPPRPPLRQASSFHARSHPM